MGNEVAVTDKDLQRASIIRKVVDALAAGRSIKDACAIAEIDERTWRSWRKEGWVQDVVNAKFKDITTGVRDLVAEAMVGSTKLLCKLAQGIVPANTSIDGVLAGRDCIAAQKQLVELWKTLGGDMESRERDQEKMIEELAKKGISITQVRIQTVNIGTEAQPMPVPVGAEVIEGEVINVVDDETL
jgi:hypothetical protein